MTPERFAVRREKLVHNLRSNAAEALLVTNPTNVSYLTGFSGSDSALLAGSTTTVLISDGRYAAQIHEECPGLEVVIRKTSQSILDAIADVLRKAKVTRLGIEAHAMTVHEHEMLSDKIKPLVLIPTSAQVEELRMVKDSDEISELRTAVRLAERGGANLVASLTTGMTELQAAYELEHAMRRFGARGASFDIIVAVGNRSALPHASPGARCVGDAGFLLLDWGATTLRGYKSDLTRLFITGKISPKIERVYRVVLKAQQRGQEAVRPGARCCDVDSAARSVIEQAGFGKNFAHSLGHGIGLEIHEGPRLSPDSLTPLRPGMVVTIEPGVYIPGWGGVRIEDDVLVTRGGCELLTSFPKSPEDAVICIG